MSIFEPFKLEEPNYNTTNIKKVYDIFPTSLRVKQLTSQQLLEFLESQIDDRDEQIEELLRRLAELLNEGSGIDEISGKLTDFTTNLTGSLDRLINETLSDVSSDTKDAQLEAEGYQKVGDNLFIKLEKKTITDEDAERFVGVDFAHNEYKKGSSTTYNPTKIKFRNTSESNTIIVQKLEKYEKAIDKNGNRVLDQEGYNDRDIRPSTSNTFKLVDLDDTTTISIEPNTEEVSRVKGETDNQTLLQFGLGRKESGTNVQHIGKMVFRTNNGIGRSDDTQVEFSMQFDRDID